MTYYDLYLVIGVAMFIMTGVCTYYVKKIADKDKKE